MSNKEERRGLRRERNSCTRAPANKNPIHQQKLRDSKIARAHTPPNNFHSIITGISNMISALAVEQPLERLPALLGAVFTIRTYALLDLPESGLLVFTIRTLFVLPGAGLYCITMLHAMVNRRDFSVSPSFTTRDSDPNCWRWGIPCLIQLENVERTSLRIKIRLLDRAAKLYGNADKAPLGAFEPTSTASRWSTQVTFVERQRGHPPAPRSLKEGRKMQTPNVCYIERCTLRMGT